MQSYISKLFQFDLRHNADLIYEIVVLKILIQQMFTQSLEVAHSLCGSKIIPSLVES